MIAAILFLFKNTLNILIIIIYVSFISSSLLSIIKLSIHYHRIDIDKKLVYLFIAFTTSTFIHYVYNVLTDELHPNASIHLLFNTTELSFLGYFITMIFEKSKIKIVILTSMAGLFIFLIVLREQLFSIQYASLILNIYDSIISFIIPTSIFIYLIKCKDEIKKPFRDHNPLIMISLGILTCYLIKVNVNSTLVLIRLYDPSYILNPISTFPYNISLLTFIELMSFIMLNIFMLKAIKSDSKIIFTAMQDRI